MTPTTHRKILASALLLTVSGGMSMAEQQPVQTENLHYIQSVSDPSDTYFGTVRAREISSLSYGARGCIVSVSDDAKRERIVKAGEVLVKLDDQRSQLALITAEARVSELAAGIEERQLAAEAARADERRRVQELEFVEEEFKRNSVMAGRGLINESAMDTIERRFMDARFAAERAGEAIANAEAAVKRAEIAHEIGILDLQSAKINLDMFTMTAPFDGVLVGFDANTGDCIQEGELAAQIYVPDQKSVDVFFSISRLATSDAAALAIGSKVIITRVNDESCGGTITRLDTEADLETQFVEATVDVEVACASSLFLNEAVEVAPVPGMNDA